MSITGVPMACTRGLGRPIFGRCPWFLLAPGDAGRFPTEFAT
jgi:hypothetical protein